MSKKEKINIKFLEALKGVCIYEKNKVYYGSTKYNLLTKNFTIDGVFMADKIDKRIEKSLDEIYLCNEWCSGGISGGSCWDDGKEDNHYATRGESEPEFTSLDNILNEICPNITYLQYKKLIAEVIKEDGYTECEYYGNSTNHSYKTILIKDLYEALKELSLL